MKYVIILGMYRIQYVPIPTRLVHRQRLRARDARTVVWSTIAESSMTVGGGLTRTKTMILI